VNQLECFGKTCRHEPHGGFLFYASFTPSIKEKLLQKYKLSGDEDLREYFGMFAPVHAGLEAEEEKDFSRYYDDTDFPEGAHIDSIGVLRVPGSMHHFTHRVSPLRNAEKFEAIEDFPYPGVKEDETGLAEKVNSAHAEGRAAAAPIVHMYESAWQLRGYEDFLMDMKARPEWCEYILDRITERNLKKAEAAARAGADYLVTGDDVASQNALMFSMDDWRRFIKSRWAKVYSAARKIKPDIEIWYHSDGNISSIIPELIEIGVTMLNPVQPECMDPAEVKKQFGSSLVIDGSIGTQTTMPFGKPDDVRRIVRKRIETLGSDGALILSPTHILEPEVPLENIEAFADEAKKSGVLE
jgi:uroporphyrinogen decarboxylase